LCLVGESTTLQPIFQTPVAQGGEIDVGGNVLFSNILIRLVTYMMFVVAYQRNQLPILPVEFG
jgi:hypothetical protein